ncbi:MAG: dockerin type I repeat-containing protein [Planctomycetota bacterium]
MRISLLAFLAAALLGSQLGAQGIITDGNANWEYTSFTSGLGNYEPEGSDDVLFRQWFWFRVDGDASETVFSPPTSNTFAGDTATLDFSEASFDAQVVNVLTDGAATDEAVVEQTVTITNTSPGELILHFYVFADLDVAGSQGDSATLDGPMTFRVVDSGGLTVLFNGIDADAYQVTTYNVLMNELNDAGIDDLNDTGLPFGPADFTGGFQWTLAIAEAGTAEVQVLYVTGPTGVQLPPTTGGAQEFLRGDANGDGVFDISDTVFQLAALFIPGSPAPDCMDSADVNDDGTSDVSDAVYALASLFIPSSPTPPAPGTDTCGEDPTDDPLDCALFAPCP